MRDFTELVKCGRVVNLLPDNYMETRTCRDICRELDEYLPVDIKIVVRNWETANNCEERHIVIITSAEAHTYIPPEVSKRQCLGAFMHYYPKTYAYDTSIEAFINVDKLHPLPLGTMRTFNPPRYIPIAQRKYDYCFIGQLDPYRRVDFYNHVQKITENTNSYIHFYKGWNNGFSSEIYAEILADSKVALVPCGSASLDTFRFYEAAQCGCVILSCQQNKYDFIRSSFFFPVPDNDWTLAKDVINIGDGNLQYVSYQTLKAWEDYLSPQASARYILQKLGFTHE